MMMMVVEHITGEGKKRKEYQTTDRHTYAYVITSTDICIYYAKEKQEE